MTDREHARRLLDASLDGDTDAWHELQRIVLRRVGSVTPAPIVIKPEPLTEEAKAEIRKAFAGAYQERPRIVQPSTLPAFPKLREEPW